MANPNDPTSAVLGNMDRKRQRIDDFASSDAIDGSLKRNLPRDGSPGVVPQQRSSPFRKPSPAAMKKLRQSFDLPASPATPVGWGGVCLFLFFLHAKKM